MFEFMKEGKGVNSYCLPERFNDCAFNLRAFNCYTPMAICLETMLKIDYLVYAEEQHITFLDYQFDDSKKRRNYSLGKLLELQAFTSWLQDKYGISQWVLDNLKGLNEQNNLFKHSLLAKKNPAQMKYHVKAFYDYSAKYYAHRSSRQAPSWPDEEYEKLAAFRERVKSRDEALRKGV